MRKLLAFTALITALTGCSAISPRLHVAASPPMEEAPAAPSPPPPPPPPPFTGTTNLPENTEIGRQFAGRDTSIMPMPTLTIVLNAYETERNQEACNAFMKLPTVLSEEAANPLAPNIIALRWPVTEVPDATNCRDIVAKYDIARGQHLLDTVAASYTGTKDKAPDINGRGPYLVEMFADEQGIHYALIDLSKTNSLDFSKIVDDLQTALVTQANGALSASVSATKKHGIAEVFSEICKGMESPLGKLIRTSLKFTPATLVEVFVVAAIDKAGCSAVAAVPSLNPGRLKHLAAR